jgi:DNA-binding transcriptional regulator YiaG/uncharacterized protein YuzE
MRYLFDRESNALTVTFAEGRRYRDSEEISDGVVVDFDTEGRPYAIEFLRADRFVDVGGLVSGQPIQLAPHGLSEAAELNAETLRQWRESLALSQEELAARLKVSASVLEAWVTGASPIDNPGVLHLALQAIEGNAHEDYLRQALRDVTESLQTYLKNEPRPLKIAVSG